jgi:AAA15 family ATPase/GTPase
MVYSFEASKDKKYEDHQVVEIADGVRLLKLGIIYGANASGKSNLLEAFEFLKDFWFDVMDSKDEETGVVPFLLDDKTSKEASKFKLIFYVESIRFVYHLTISANKILHESLLFYPGTQPAIIFERELHNNISEITFGPKIKISQVAKDEISIKCLSNMSFFAAYNGVNLEIEELELASKWMSNQFMNSIGTEASLVSYSENLISKDKTVKEKMLEFLQQADFNISNINTEIIKKEITEDFLNQIKVLNIPIPELEKVQKERSIDTVKTTFEHKVINKDESISYKELPLRLQSNGTKRIFGLSGGIIKTIEQNAFLAIDEIESKLHPRLIEFVLEKFLRESEQAQLLVTTHYDGLLEEDDLLRKDSIWFTEKQVDASTNLYSLADFKAVNRITSLQKAYKYGKFGAVPNIE